MAGTVQQALSDVRSERILGKVNFFRVITFTCVGDESAGTIPATPVNTANLAAIKGLYFHKAQIVPGTPAPTADSDILLKDANGIDLLGGNGTDQLDATGAKEAYPIINTKGGSQPVLDTLTLSVTGNTAAASQFVIKAVFGLNPLPVSGLT